MGARPQDAGAEPPQAPLPPWSEPAEEYVLGAMMLAGSAVDAVTPIVDAGDFYRASHGRIFRAIVAQHGQLGGTDAESVIDRLRLDGQLEDAGGRDRIEAIYKLVPAASNAAHHAAIVARLARLRDFITVGQRIAQLGWDGGDTEHALTTAQDLLGGLEERNVQAIPVETWHEFERQAHDVIPVLIEGLWPEASLAFIGAGPKKGKTWIALAIAIAVATGRPLFGQYLVPKPQPVLYVALEGHRAALRARVGAIARGMGIDPDGDELRNLHFIYKPRGMNLADPAWAQRLRYAAGVKDARLIIVDVLRAGAVIKENDQAEFTRLRHNLQPINDDGRSLALLHHNVKLSEISKERDPGERLSGSGAMYGALDVGIYITGSEDHARKLRLAFDLRDLATPDDITIALEGEGTAPNGGYGYLDAAAWRILEEDELAEDAVKVTAQQIADYVIDHGGDVQAPELTAYFEVSRDTIDRRQQALEKLHIYYDGGRGKTARYVHRPPAPKGHEQLPIDPPESSATPEIPHAETPDDAEPKPHNQATNGVGSAQSRNHPMRNHETADLQAEPVTANAAPYGSTPTRAHTREARPERLAAAKTWIDDQGWWLDPDDLTTRLLTDHHINAADLPDLIAYAAARAAAEAPAP